MERRRDKKRRKRKNNINNHEEDNNIQVNDNYSVECENGLLISSIVFTGYKGDYLAYDAIKGADIRYTKRITANESEKLKITFEKIITKIKQHQQI